MLSAKTMLVVKEWHLGRLGGHSAAGNPAT